jgi:branched-chain amino acid aminotransferase
MNDFRIIKTEKTRFNDIDFNNLGFGKYFSDHMYLADYKDGKWEEGCIMPYGPLPMEPGLCTLHYGQTIFEGLKAFHSVKGGINIFRPEMNAKRLNHSATRLCIPEYDTGLLVDAIVQLAKVDYNFIPKERGCSLYIRPVMFGSGNFLGVHSSDTFRLIVMTSPVASYYSEGLNPVNIMISYEYVRAVKGGLGTAKTAANYAASLLAGTKAKEAGYSQVLWLDGITHEFIDEVGAMNIMFIIGDELITPPLDQGTILAGITRDTVLILAREWGIKVTERPLKINEVFEAHKNGQLKEVFGTGTAAVISPVGQLNFKGAVININNREIGPVAQKLYDTITGIQYGEIEDKYGWNVHFE